MLMLPKTPVVRDREYLDSFRDAKCILTNQYGNEYVSVVGAHIRLGGDAGSGGTSYKPSDDRVLPLLKHLHDEQGVVGELTFWRDAFAMNDRLLIEAIIALAEKRYRQWQSR